MTAACFGLSTTVITAICGVLAKHAKVQRAMIYGSRAKGNHHPGSDIDLTLFAVRGEAIDVQELADILDELDELLLPYTIDLSAFDQLTNTSLRDHIQRVGRIFYEQSH